MGEALQGSIPSSAIALVWLSELSELLCLSLAKRNTNFHSVSLMGFLIIESKVGFMKCKLLYGCKPYPLPEVIKPDGIWCSYSDGHPLLEDFWKGLAFKTSAPRSTERDWGPGSSGRFPNSSVGLGGQWLLRPQKPSGDSGTWREVPIH